jgi:FkbM family methyltransferase
MRTSTKRILRNSLLKVGLDVKFRSGPHHLADSWHDYMRFLFAHFQVATVIDVGANVGQFGLLLRKTLDFKGRIASFEPVTEALTELRKLTSNDPDWLVFDYALGEFDEVSEFNVLTQSTMSSLLQPNSHFTDTFPRHAVARVEEVRVRRLDQDLLQSVCAGASPGGMLLKVDTQGFDDRVLRGAEPVLEEFVAIQTELSFSPFYESQAPASEVIQFLASNGFVLSGVFPIFRDKTTLQLVEADGVFVRESARSQFLSSVEP